MGLVVLRYKTHHAWGESKKLIRFVECFEDWTEEVFLKELIEGIHDSYSFSDKYRGCDAELISLEEVPLKELEQELEYKFMNLESLKKNCNELQEAIDKVKSV